MLDQHPRGLSPIHRIASTQPWIEPTARALRRAQPPPAPPTPRAAETERVRRSRRFWGYFALTVVLATMVPVTAAIGVNIADSTWFRVLVAIAISAAAALAVLTSSCASAHAAPRRRRQQGRIRC
jgi:hypothetical protein